MLSKFNCLSPCSRTYIVKTLPGECCWTCANPTGILYGPPCNPAVAASSILLRCCQHLHFCTTTVHLSPQQPWYLDTTCEPHLFLSLPPPPIAAAPISFFSPPSLSLPHHHRRTTTAPPRRHGSNSLRASCREGQSVSVANSTSVFVAAALVACPKSSSCPRSVL